MPRIRNRCAATLVLTGLTTATVLAPPDDRPGHGDDAPRWWKGNTHTHTYWSDGDAAPEHVIDWYVRHGYDFLVLSDHNVLSRGDRWFPISTDGPRPLRPRATWRRPGSSRSSVRPPASNDPRERAIDQFWTLMQRQVLMKKPLASAPQR